MFLLNVGYQWSIVKEAPVSGAVFRASGQDLEGSLRRLRPNHLQSVLFDPQLQFLDYQLDTQDYPTLIARLCTYPWFCMDAPDYDSGEGARSDWLKEIKANVEAVWNDRRVVDDDWESVIHSSVAFQERFGCTEIILPSKLLADPEDSLDSYFDHLDEAVEVASKVTERPVLVGVPMDEGLVAHRDPQTSEVVEALADGISARGTVGGVYLTVSSDVGPGMHILNPKAAGAILRLCQLLGRDAGLRVVVNFVESLGLAALGFGAKAYASGFSRKGRCFRLEDYQDREGGAAYPKFHSRRLGLDFYPEADLSKLRDSRMLRYLEADRSPSGAPLLDALSRGLDATAVPQWEQRRNNVRTSKLHYAEVHSAAGKEDWTPDRVQAWLQDAESAWLYLSSRFEDDPLTAPQGRHLAPWRRAVEHLLP